MKIILFFFSCFFLITILKAQNFYFDIKDTYSNVGAYTVINDINGNYIISITGDSSKVLKVNTSGVILQEKIFTTQVNYLISSFVNDGNDIIGIGFLDTGNSYDVMIIRFDTLLNILDEKVYSSDKYYYPRRIIKDINNDFICVGYYSNNLYDNLFPLIMKFDSNLDSLKFVELIYPYSGYYWDIKENKENTGYYVITESPLTPSVVGDLKIVNYNHNLEIDTIYNYNPNNNYHAGWKNQLEWYKNNSLIVGGLYVYYTGPYGNEHQDEASALIKIDMDFNVSKFKKFGSPDTSEYPSFVRSFAITPDNYIYNCATSNIYNMSYWPYQQQPSWIMLNKVDSNFNVIWKKYYGGDAYYNPDDIIATSDGGCIITGFRYDYLTQNQEKDVFVLKVDNNGLITNIAKNSGIKTYNAILFPNPATTKINIRVVDNYQNSTIKITNISGKQIISEQIEGTAKQLNIETLKSGIYLYNILNNSEIIESGKFVKE